MKLLGHSNVNIRKTAIYCLFRLGGQGKYPIVHFEPFALLRPLPSEATTGYPARDFRGDEIAGALQQGYLLSCN
jgi:hypothetical protein